jgi:hypothetical protein
MHADMPRRCRAFLLRRRDAVAYRFCRQPAAMLLLPSADRRRAMLPMTRHDAIAMLMQRRRFSFCHFAAFDISIFDYADFHYYHAPDTTPFSPIFSYYLFAATRLASFAIDFDRCH